MENRLKINEFDIMAHCKEYYGDQGITKLHVHVLADVYNIHVTLKYM